MLRQKILNWLSFQKKNENLRLFLIATSIWFVCFIKPIVGKTYTSWDTHDLGFVNFLYFSDSLMNGSFPLWNHFIQSGTFFPSFNNIGVFSPLQLIFVALSWVVSPVYAYELFIQTAVIIGGVGSYLLCRTYKSDGLVALFGGAAFAVAVLLPIVGQIHILISLSSFPWIILAVIKITESRDGEILRHVIWGTLAALYLMSGYLWMNLLHLIIAGFFAMGICIKKYINAEVAERKVITSIVVNLLIFFTVIVFLYGCVELPAYLSMHFNYEVLNGDYKSPEPRLRSLNANGDYFSYGSLFKAFIGAIDPRIYMNNPSWFAELPRWSFGAGWVLWIMFLVIPSKKFLGQQIFWILLAAVALMYSAGNSNFIGILAKNIPVINANRWWFIGIYYVIIGLIFLVVIKISTLKDMSVMPKNHGFRLLLVGVLSLSLLTYFNSPVIEFFLVSASLLLVWLFGRKNNSANLLTALIALSVVSIASMPYSGISWPARYLLVTDFGGYEKNVIVRNKEVAITQNFRRLGQGHDYIYNDEQWLLQKIPFTHGYNNLGNPYYWYLKNNPVLEHLVFVTQNVRPEIKLERKNFNSDNTFVEALMDDVLADMSKPTLDVNHFRKFSPVSSFSWQLDELNIEPNTARVRVTTNAPAYLVFNNVNHPGWDVYINGKKTELIRTNRIFQGVFLDGAGNYDVVFEFRPILTIVLISLPYIFLLFFVILYRRKIRSSRKLYAN